jgi:hypothetical protein
MGLPRNHMARRSESEPRRGRGVSPPGPTAEAGTVRGEVLVRIPTKASARPAELLTGIQWASVGQAPTITIPVLPGAVSIGVVVTDGEGRSAKATRSAILLPSA